MYLPTILHFKQTKPKDQIKMPLFGTLALLWLTLAGHAIGSQPVSVRQQATTWVPGAAPTSSSHDHGPTLVTRAASQRDTFDFEVRSDQIVLMMDGLADVAARIAETRDPDFYKKDDDDAPPFKCHCKCSLLGGCECWCGDKDKDKKGGRDD